MKDEGFHDHAVTILLVAWGQFIDHDITLTAETKVQPYILHGIKGIKYNIKKI